MRLATITNWAYGTTVALALVSGATMLLASGALERERYAVEQRHQLDQVTSRLGADIYALTDRARQYLNTGDPTYLIVYRRAAADLRAVDDRIRHIGTAGASAQELATLKKAIGWEAALRDEQAEALAAYERGDATRARQILFGAEYERELDQVESLVGEFQAQLDRRIEAELAAATRLARIWKSLSEIALVITGLMFLGVLYFIFKRRVLRPVVKLSDVITRLAAQDYAAEPPDIPQIDEIGDMAQAIRIFRENGIERQRLEAERDADRTMRDLLSRMTQRMQGCDTLSDLQAVIARFVPEVVPDLAGRLYLLDDKRGAVVEACSWLDPRHSRAEFPPIACWALRRGLPHRPTGGHVDVPCDHLDAAPGALPDTLCLPLIAHRETLGLLYFEPLAVVTVVLRTPAVFLEMLAENISLALANLRLRDALRAMALADPLTGLANRRHLDAILDTELADAARSGRPISCLMVDVDFFKRFNDSFGHDAGDAVLREVGLLLKGLTRQPEFAFRYGGEEFMLLFPGLDVAEAGARAQEILARIAQLRVSHAGAELGPITASIGAATAPAQCTTDQLVRAADAALLRAKALGRNRVETACARKDEKRTKRASAA